MEGDILLLSSPGPDIKIQEVLWIGSLGWKLMVFIMSSMPITSTAILMWAIHIPVLEADLRI
jgi:hypothetical protein